jgi:hypothetical protein
MGSKNRKRFWILIVISSLLSLLYLLGQTMAFINYDFTVMLELQEPVEEITEIGVALNKGFGVGDTVVYLPLLIAGIIGLIKRKQWGLFSMTGALAITIYWPIVCLATLLFAKGSSGFNLSDYISYLILLPIISMFGIWGLWFIFQNRKELVFTCINQR